MQLPYYIVNMNLPGFTVPETISMRPPSQQEQNRYRTSMEAWKKDNEGKPDAEKTEKPNPPTTVMLTASAVCHYIIKTALQMSVPEGRPDTLRRLQKIYKAIEDGMDNGGQLFLSKDDYKFVQSKYAKADKWNTNPDVCKIVIAVQDAISRAAYVDKKIEK